MCECGVGTWYTDMHLWLHIFIYCTMTIFVGCKDPSIGYKVLGQGVWYRLKEIGYIALKFRVQDVVGFREIQCAYNKLIKKETL